MRSIIFLLFPISFFFLEAMNIEKTETYGHAHKYGTITVLASRARQQEPPHPSHLFCCSRDKELSEGVTRLLSPASFLFTFLRFDERPEGRRPEARTVHEPSFRTRSCKAKRGGKEGNGERLGGARARYPACDLSARTGWRKRVGYRNRGDDWHRSVISFFNSAN